MNGDKLVQLPVRKKPAPGEERTLIRVESVPCGHFGPVLVNEALAEVECAACHAKLNPMWVLQRMANRETAMERHRETYQGEMQRLAERSKTKCQHCHQMTRISRA